MGVPHVDTRLWDGTISDVLHENVAKVGGARAKAVRISDPQGLGYARTKAYLISPGMLISRPDITDVLQTIVINHPIGKKTFNSRAMGCPPVGHYIALEPELLWNIDKLRFRST